VFTLLVQVVEPDADRDARGNSLTTPPRQTGTRHPGTGIHVGSTTDYRSPRGPGRTVSQSDVTSATMDDSLTKSCGTPSWIRRAEITDHPRSFAARYGSRVPPEQIPPVLCGRPTHTAHTAHQRMTFSAACPPLCTSEMARRVGRSADCPVTRFFVRQDRANHQFWKPWKGTAHMATVTFVAFADDIDGSKAAETVSFALDGVAYEIDLNAKHATAIRKELAEFIAAARTAQAGRFCWPTSRAVCSSEMTQVRRPGAPGASLR